MMGIKKKLAVVLLLSLTLGALNACTVNKSNDGGDVNLQDTAEEDNGNIYGEEADAADSRTEGAGSIDSTDGTKNSDSNDSDGGSDSNDSSDGSDSKGGSDKDNEDDVNQYIAQMTLEEKVAQLFIIQPEALMKGVDTVTAAGETTQKAIDQIPVGGFIYLDDNLQSREQVKTMLEHVQSYSIERTGLPMFLSVDEEGGTVARISGSGRFDVPQMEDMSVIGARGDSDEAYEVGKTIGAYLHDMGFNIDFAPVADVLTNQENQVVKKRAFGSDPELVSDMALAVARGLKEQDIYPVYKHFPGHGGTAADTHEGYAYVDKSIEELEEQDLVPFRKAISNGAEMIMVGHISLPEVTGDDTPASMSSVIIADLLRTKLGYDGLIVTDALNMGAVTEQYTSGQAAVQTILAGGDLVLMPVDFEAAYEGVLDAVKSGTISEERVDESLKRILRLKLTMTDVK